MNVNGRASTSDHASVFAQQTSVRMLPEFEERPRDENRIELDMGYEADEKTGYIPEHDILGRRKPKSLRKGG